MRSLFLTYDGLLSPLGQSQILPYLRGLHQEGHEVSVLSFERARDGLAQPGCESRRSATCRDAAGRDVRARQS